MIKVLTDLGSNYPKQTNNEDIIIFNTVCHNKTGGKYKLSYIISGGVFTCFTECADSFDIYEVVRKNKALYGVSMGFYESVEYVVELTGHYIGRKRQVGFGKPNYIVNDWDFIQGYDIKETQATVYSPINKEYLDCYDNIYHDTWIKDGISILTMRDYGIRYSVIDHQIIIPHYHSVSGDLIGIRARNLLPELLKEDKKYMPVYLQDKAFNHALGGNLYGMYHNKKAIKRLKKIMIVESEKGVMQADTIYKDSNFTVAICSSNITNMQRNLIIDSDIEEVILGFDKDFPLDSVGYEKKMKKICKLAQKFVPYMRVYVLEDQEDLLDLKDSPIDKGQEVLEQLMKNKIELTMDIINQVLKGE